MHIETIQITPEILSLIAEIDEFKGAWRALGQLAPETLTSLKRVATIESIGSSTRIEGSKLSDQAISLLLTNLDVQKFTTRDEAEVAGYSEVMTIIFQNYQDIPLTENYIQQLHRMLLQYSTKDNWHSGSYKKTSNHVEAFDQDGKSIGVIFETASPFETPIRMAQLIEWARQCFADKQLHPLLISAIVIVTFLALHPFQDGNGRLSRVLTTYLLLKEGYQYVPYSSLEAVIEQNKEAYYLALRQTQGTLQTETPDWQPWLLFFLSALRQQKQRLENKIAKEQLLMVQLPPLSLQIIALIQSRGSITNSDIVAITNANRNTVKKHLETLVAKQYIQKNGQGKATWYSVILK
ncbi:Fic family protein [Parasediminibacterium paludis]|uniref:Fic family protein n=1 Tax=Parasediminibacterium paludis TaxID=908966 RepID=A0ABV8Q146_9BACT